MRRFIISIFILQISAFSLLSQASADSVKHFVQYAIEELSFELLNQEYDEEVIADNFDFFIMKPNHSIQDSGLFFKCYYANSELVGVSAFDSKYNKLNYDFGFHYAEDYVYVVARHHDNAERTADNYKVYGFFVIDKKSSKAFFFGPVYFGDELANAMASVRNVYLLNNQLKASHKLVFLSRKLYYLSLYDYSTKKVNEKIWQYLWHPNIPLRGCGKYKNLDRLSVSDLERLFKNPALCPCQTVGTAEPRDEFIGETIPFVWDINQYYHK